MTFYAYPETMHRPIQTTNAIESLAEQCAPTHRSDRCLYDGNQLPTHCLGHDPGYPLAPASRWNEATELRTTDAETTSHEGWFSRGCLFVRLLALSHRSLRFLLLSWHGFLSHHPHPVVKPQVLVWLRLARLCLQVGSLPFRRVSSSPVQLFLHQERAQRQVRQTGYSGAGTDRCSSL